MQNAGQNSASESVGNCVKQHEVGLHRASANPTAATPATSVASAKPSKSSHCNSVPKSNQSTGRGNNHPTLTHHHHPSLANSNHKTVTVSDLTNSSSTTLATEIAIQQVKLSRPYHQYMPDSSDSDSDDVLSESEVEVCTDDCRCPSSSASSLDAPRFLLAAAAAAQHDGHNIGELPRIDPDTQARIEALLEAAGIGKLTGVDSKRLGDQEVLSRLTSSVSCALDEAAAALNRMRSDNPINFHQEARSLVEACSDGDVSAVRRLLDEGRSVHETTEEGESLLSLACSAGYYELAQVLLAMRANVEDRGVKGDCTPLMEAASAGNGDIVRLLLEHGADVNAQSSSGNTPLMYACAGGHEEVVKLLLDAGANVEDHNENGHTPLMEAASAGHVGVAKILLQHGAGINTHSNEFKESALTLACYKGHLEMVRFLLEAGADQEHKTDEMHTALMEASMDGHVEVARLLLDSGAQVNMPADSFESPLTLAACGGHVELAMLLLERGANIEEVNDEGYTPLMEAAREGHEEMVALLLSQGADINAQTEETQETALTLACCGGFSEVADFLIKAGADIELGASTPLMEAAQEGHLDLVRYLLEAGANVHAQTGTGDTALTYACENGHTDVAELLLQYGADLEHASEGGRTPLMKAARAGHLCTVQYLISRGADVHRQTTNNDHTPLSLACAGGHYTVVELLLLHGANPFHRLKDNSTMIIEAAKSGHTQVVQLLLDYPTSILSKSEVQQMPPGMSVPGSLPGGADEPAAAVTDAVPTPAPRVPPVGGVAAPGSVRPDPQGAAAALTSLLPPNAPLPPVATSLGPPPSGAPAPITSISTLAAAAQKMLTKKPADPCASPGPATDQSGNKTLLPPHEHQPARFQMPAEALSSEKSQLADDDSKKTQPVSSHPTALIPAAAAALSQVLNLELPDPSRPGSGGAVVGVPTPTSVNLEDIVKLLEELPQLEFEPSRPPTISQMTPTPAAPTPSQQQQQQQQPRESVIVTNPNAVSSSTSGAAPAPTGAAVSPASLPPAERPKAKPVKNKIIKKQQQQLQQQHQQQLQQQQQLQSGLVQQQQQQQQQCPQTQQLQQLQQMQQLQQLQQLNQHLQQQVMQQRQLKQQNQATLAALQQNALQNQAQLAALQQNVAQLQQLEQQVLAPAYTAGVVQGPSAAAATAHFQQCVQQILQQKQQLQQQIRLFQLQVEQQLAYPQPLPAGRGGNADADAPDANATPKIPTGVPDETKAGSPSEEVKSPNRAEKRPIDSTSSDETNAAGLQVTGAPVPLFATQDLSATNIGIQVQGSVMANGPTGQCVSGITFQPLPGTVVPCSTYSGTNGQITIASAGSAGQPGVSVPVSGLQVVTSQSSSLAIHPQLLMQPRQIPSGQTVFEPVANTTGPAALPSPSDAAKWGFNVGTFTVPQAPAGAGEQQAQQPVTVPQTPAPASAAPADKKIKTGKKTKATTQNVQQIYSTTDANGHAVGGINGTIQSGQPPFDSEFGEYPPFAAGAVPTASAGTGTSTTPPVLYGACGVPAGGVPVPVPVPAAGTAASGAVAGQSLLPMLDLDSETDSNHDTALTLACTGGHEELVELLLSRGADIEHRDKKGFTPLILAATAGHEKVVEVLITHGANIEAQSERTKDTALSLACSGGRYEVVEFLLTHGANKEHRNVSDYTPLSLAASGGYVNIIRLLLSHSAEINSRTGSKLGISPLMLAAMNGHVAAVRTLLDMGSDINAQIETNRNTALTLACFQGRHEVVQLLLEKKANVEHRAKTGLTPLMEAASGGYVEVGRVLLDYGADVNAPPVPSSRDTALTIAADKGHVEFVELLLQRGAQPDVKNKKGNSPLWLAANGGHLEVVELLYKAKADIDSQDNRKVSCLMAAFRKGHVKVVKWMVKRVTQFPSDQEMTRYISTAVDKDLLKKCHHCLEVIRAAKDHQAAEANKNAANLLDELDMEKIREDQKRAAAARKREKKKRKKQEKKQEKKKAENDDADNESQEPENGNENDDEKEVDTIEEDNQSDAGEAPDTVEPAHVNNNKESEQATKGGKRKKKQGNQDDDAADVAAITKRKDSVEQESQLNKKSSPPPPPPPIITTSADDAQPGKNSKRKKENAPAEPLVIQTDKSSKNLNQRNGNESETLKEVSNLSSSLKSLSPTSVTSPKRPLKREEGWKEVVRRGPVGSRENSSSNIGTGSGGGKKSQSSDRSSVTLNVIQSTERSKKVTVPSNAISRVIGRAGCNINAIREISGAHIEIEKQGKGQGDRTVLIKGTAESIRQSQQLITALIKEPEREFNELMAKFRAANAAAKAGAAKPAAPAAAQPKMTRAATTIASTKPTQTAPTSGQPAPAPSTVAWGAVNTLITAAPSPKRAGSVPSASTVAKTPQPPTIAAVVQQPPKSGAVRQLFPDSSPVPSAAAAVKKPAAQATTASAVSAAVKPSVSYSVAGSNAPSSSTSTMTRTTPVTTTLAPSPVKPSSQPSAASKTSEKTSPLASGPAAAPSTQSQPATSSSGSTGQSQAAAPGTSIAGSAWGAPVSSRPGSTSPAQDYSLFNSQPFWPKEQQQQSSAKLSKNFAAVAAAGVSPVPSKTAASVPTSLSSSLPVDGGQNVLAVDAAKAPGYRREALSATSQSQSEGPSDLPTSMASSAPGTPIPSAGPIRPPVGSRLHPLTPPPRIGSPPIFNPTPVQPVLGPVGSRHLPPTSSAPPDSMMVPPPSAPSLAPGGPAAVRVRPTNRLQHDAPQPQPPFGQADGLGMPGFYGVPRPSGPMGSGVDNQRQTASFPLAPGVGGPPRAGPQQGFPPTHLIGSGSRLSFPPAFGMGAANGNDMKQHMPTAAFGTDFPPPMGTPFGGTNDTFRIMGFPGPGVANRMTGPPPPTQPGSGLLDGAPGGQNPEGYSGGPPQRPPMMDVGERKIPRPIGTERAMSRRTPGPPPAAGVAFSPDLWYHPGADMGPGAGPIAPPMSMNPSTLPPALGHGDWMTMPIHGPNVSVPAPHASDESGLLYMPKQQSGMPHHHHHHAFLQRQMDGVMGEGGESLEMQFTGGMNGGGGSAAPNANAGSFHHPAGPFMNGMPPPGMPGGAMGAQLFPGAMPAGQGQTGPGDQQHGDAMNGMWIAPGSNLKGKVSGPSPSSVMGEQQVPDNNMMWMKWSQQ